MSTSDTGQFLHAGHAITVEQIPNNKQTVRDYKILDGDNTIGYTTMTMSGWYAKLPGSGLANELGTHGSQDAAITAILNARDT